MKRITLATTAATASAVVAFTTFALVSGTEPVLSAQRYGRGPVNTTPAQHKQMMDDAGDEQDNLRELIGGKDVKGAAASAKKIDAFMVETQTYWAAKKFADVNKLADLSVAQSKAVVTATAAGKLDEAKAAMEKLSATCNACHELHPEKRK